jgi:hypothetical protein
MKKFQGWNLTQQFGLPCVLVVMTGGALNGAFIGFSNIATALINRDQKQIEQKIGQNTNDGKEVVSEYKQPPEVEITIAEIAEPLEKASGTNPNDKDINDDFTAMELTATNYAGLKQWKESVKCYRWLFQQNIAGPRMAGIINSFQYVSDLWEFDKDGDFGNNVSLGLVGGFINNTHVNFRQGPSTDSYVIRQFKLYEEVKILQQSNFKKNIGDVTTFWYKISTDDGTEGWIFGQYLCFYPSLPKN